MAQPTTAILSTTTAIVAPTSNTKSLKQQCHNSNNNGTTDNSNIINNNSNSSTNVKHKSNSSNIKRIESFKSCVLAWLNSRAAKIYASKENLNSATWVRFTLKAKGLLCSFKYLEDLNKAFPLNSERKSICNYIKSTRDVKVSNP